MQIIFFASLINKSTIMKKFKRSDFQKIHKVLLPGDEVTFKVKVRVLSEMCICIHPVPEHSEDDPLPF